MEDQTVVKYTEKDIVLDLLSIDVCSRCCLRVLSEETLDRYKHAEEHVNKIVSRETTEEVPSKMRKGNTCVACLGLLEDTILNDISGKVIKEVETGCYDSDHMTCALSLPISFQLRNHSLWLYVSNKYYGYFIEKFGCKDKIKKDFVLTSVKEVWKLLTANVLSQGLKKILTNDTNRYFFVNINLTYEFDERETSFLAFVQHPSLLDRKKTQGDYLTRKSVETVLNDINFDVLKKYYTIPPGIPNDTIKCNAISCRHDSIYIAGRYNKFSRSLCQTPWIVNGEKKMESSIQDLITDPVNQVINNDGISFIGSGREDVDVRMLGRGRPFCLEVMNPKKTKLTRAEFKNLEDVINKNEDIFVRDLQLARKDQLHFIKQGEESKTKTYSCLCVIPVQESNNDELLEKIVSLANKPSFDVDQTTPIRVLHRRPLSVRQRTIHWLKPTFHKVENNLLYFKLQLKVQAGTYVKEFVHGDFGRTEPNLSLILDEEVDIVALDVEEVHLDWPPSLCD